MRMTPRQPLVRIPSEALLSLLLALAPCAVLRAGEAGGASSAGAPADAVAVLGETVIRRSALFREMARQIGRPTLNRLLAPELLAQEMRRRNMEITPEELGKAYAEAEAEYRLRNGRLPFLQALKEGYGLTPEQYKTDVLRPDLMAKKLLASELQINDADLANFYFAKRTDLYTEPEAVRISHILIDPRRLLPEVEGRRVGILGDREWQQAYAKALEIKRRLRDGADFAELARQLSHDERTAPQGGAVGWIPRGQGVNQALEDAAYALADGEVSEPVKTIMGYHLVRREERRPERQLEYSAVKDRVRADYAAYLRDANLQRLLQDLEAAALREGRLRILLPLE